MAALITYTGGSLPHVGDYVRSVHPDGPRHGLTVLSVGTRHGRTSSLRCVEDVTGKFVTVPARQLDLMVRADLEQAA
jgi:hypothetical protein